MRISKKALKSLDRGKRFQVALALGFTEQWITRVFEANKINGPLTTIRALKVIQEQTGLTDAEILEQEKERA